MSRPGFASSGWGRADDLRTLGVRHGAARGEGSQSVLARGRSRGGGRCGAPPPRRRAARQNGLRSLAASNAMANATGAKIIAFPSARCEIEPAREPRHSSTQTRRPSHSVDSPGPIGVRARARSASASEPAASPPGSPQKSARSPRLDVGRHRTRSPGGPDRAFGHRPARNAPTAASATSWRVRKPMARPSDSTSAGGRSGRQSLESASAVDVRMEACHRQREGARRHSGSC